MAITSIPAAGRAITVNMLTVITESALPVAFEAELELASDFARASKAKATQQAYSSDFRIFDNQPPLCLAPKSHQSFLPSDMELEAAYGSLNSVVESLEAGGVASGRHRNHFKMLSLQQRLPHFR
jgi:hypothetical protein